jgi:hemin uptake protein HemP
MHSTLTSLAASSRTNLGASAELASDMSQKPATLVESTDLLKGHKTVGILHNGSLYRLQATKLGKLILTK